MNKKNTPPLSYRHGDVFLEEVATLPDGTVSRSNPIVAYGEVTGHCHTIVPLEGVIADEADFKLYEKDGVLYLFTGSKGAAIVHQEHAKIPLPKEKTFVIGIQQEWAPTGARNVQD